MATTSVAFRILSGLFPFALQKHLVDLGTKQLEYILRPVDMHAQLVGQSYPDGLTTRSQ